MTIDGVMDRTSGDLNPQVDLLKNNFSIYFEKAYKSIVSTEKFT